MSLPEELPITAQSLSLVALPLPVLLLLAVTVLLLLPPPPLVVLLARQ